MNRPEWPVFFGVGICGTSTWTDIKGPIFEGAYQVSSKKQCPTRHRELSVDLRIAVPLS
jgi:hypothetical protein